MNCNQNVPMSNVVTLLQGNTINNAIINIMWSNAVTLD